MEIALLILLALAYAALIVVISRALAANHYERDEVARDLNEAAGTLKQLAGGSDLIPCPHPHNERRRMPWAAPRVDSILDHLKTHPYHSRAWAKHDLLALGVSPERTRELLSGATRRSTLH